MRVPAAIQLMHDDPETLSVEIRELHFSRKGNFVDCVAGELRLIPGRYLKCRTQHKVRMQTENCPRVTKFNMIRFRFEAG
jgi:hypothetical protein